MYCVFVPYIKVFHSHSHKKHLCISCFIYLRTNQKYIIFHNKQFILYIY